MATIEDITIIGLLCILLIFALRNFLMVNAMCQMLFGTHAQYLTLMEDLNDIFVKEESSEKEEEGEWRDWDKE